MEKQYLKGIKLADVNLSCIMRFQDTANYLKTILYDIQSSEDSQDSFFKPVSVSQQGFESWARAGNPIDAFSEFCLLCMPVSEALLDYNCCIFHAAAISYKGKAWLITAGSGVGKSTQCRNLMSLWPGEFSVINGDKPVLEVQGDGHIIVHPSPWNGKEGWKGANAAPLGGIILLHRGHHDSITSIAKEKAAVEVFMAVFQDYRDDVKIRQAAAMAEKITESCPVWLMTSCNLPDSTKLLYACLKGEAEKNEL